MKKERNGLTNGYGGIRPFDPGGQTKKMSPKTPFNTFGRFNDRLISSNNGKNPSRLNLRKSHRENFAWAAELSIS